MATEASMNEVETSEDIGVVTDPMNDNLEITAGTYPLDNVISQRNRRNRTIFLAVFAIALPFLGILLGLGLSNMVFESSIAGWLGAIFGFGLGGLGVMATLERFFIIRNNTTSIFVTINQLATLLAQSNAYTVYGPGTHLCYPWEKRVEENNISLEEVSSDVSFTVQTKDGVITGKGSYRLRADPARPIAFLLGVASVAGEVSDIIERHAAQFFLKEDKGVLQAVKMIKEINAYLQKKLVVGTSPEEMRFGIELTDVTIKQLLPSEELQRAVTAKAEAKAVQEGVRMLLNCSSKPELDRKLASGALTTADVNQARDRFLSMSGNLENVEIRRNEFDVKIEGLDPEAVKALTDLARSPAAVAAATRAGAGKKGGDNK